MELRSSGKAAIVFQPLPTADFSQIVADMEESCAVPARRSSNSSSLFPRGLPEE